MSRYFIHFCCVHASFPYDTSVLLFFCCFVVFGCTEKVAMIPEEEALLSQREIIMDQCEVVAQIVRDETWLEGERRKIFVAEHDPIVQLRVAEVILKEGGKMRSKSVRRLRAAG